MTLMRAAARTMLASYFIASGVKAVRKPEPLVPLAEPLAEKVVPLVKKYAPDQVSGYIPEDALTLVRVNGITQIVGGLALASGKGRRPGAWLLAGSLIPSTIAKYPFWSESDPEQKALARAHFSKNVSLLGGVLLAAGDTEGKPSIAWRAQKGGQHLARDSRKAAKQLGKRASALAPSHSVGDNVSDLAGTALAGGAALVATVAKSTRKTRKQAAAAAKRAQKVAAEQAAKAKAVAAEQAEEARKAAVKAAKQAKKDAPKQLAAAKKTAAEQAKAARKAVKKGKDNIQLGEN